MSTEYDVAMKALSKIEQVLGNTAKLPVSSFFWQGELRRVVEYIDNAEKQKPSVPVAAPEGEDSNKLPFVNPNPAVAVGKAVEASSADQDKESGDS